MGFIIHCIFKVNDAYLDYDKRQKNKKLNRLIN